MAIVSFGSEQLTVGAAPVNFAQVTLDSKFAYLMYASFAVDNPNNIFSFCRIRALMLPSEGTPYYYPKSWKTDITQTSSSFWLPLSGLLDKSQTLQFQTERLPYIRNLGEDQTPVTLTISYDDSTKVDSWIN